ncbi:hypothetical protein ACFRFH_18050 [Leifsonia sp. NPDC056824]|uniref:hypothetical protein n=1 Tax=Leifsonia sp. NPDC056824 TaxID=3345953 RepID=UPI00367B8195
MTSGDLHREANTDGPQPALSRSWLNESAAVAITLGLVALAVAAITVGIGSLCVWAQSGAF